MILKRSFLNKKFNDDIGWYTEQHIDWNGSEEKKGRLVF